MVRIVQFIAFAAVCFLLCAGAPSSLQTIIAAQPVSSEASFPQTGVLSAFTGTNGTNPTGFTEAVGGVQIQSNQCTGDAVATNVAVWNTTYTADNIENYFTIPVLPSGNYDVNIYIADSGFDGYAMVVDRVAGTDTFQVFLLDAGSNGDAIGAAEEQEVSAGDSIGLYKNGSTLQMWYKAAAGSWTQIGANRTDSTYSGCDTLAFGLFDTTVRVDDFGGGTH
jgi:hypothetical protein